MDVRLVTVKRSFNLGGFDSLSVEAQAATDVDEDPEKVIGDLASKLESAARSNYGHHIVNKKS